MEKRERGYHGVNSGAARKAKKFSHDRTIPSRVHNGHHRLSGLNDETSPHAIFQGFSQRDVYHISERISMSAFFALSEPSAIPCSWDFEPFALYWTQVLSHCRSIKHLQGLGLAI